MKDIKRMFKIDVVKKLNARTIRWFYIFLFLLFVAILIDIFDVFKISAMMIVLMFFSLFFIFLFGEFIRIAISSSEMSNITDDDITTINRDFKNRNGYIYDYLHLGLFDDYLFSYYPFVRYYKYVDIQKLIYDNYCDEGIKKYCLSVFTNDGVSISLLFTKEPIDKEVDEIVKYLKKNGKSIQFVNLVKSEKDR